MPNYRRAFIPGGTYFFTVNLLQRHDNNLLIPEVNFLRDTVQPQPIATNSRPMEPIGSDSIDIIFICKPLRSSIASTQFWLHLSIH